MITEMQPRSGSGIAPMVQRVVHMPIIMRTLKVRNRTKAVSVVGNTFDRMAAYPA
jgi:hypothetical protein